MGGFWDMNTLGEIRRSPIQYHLWFFYHLYPLVLHLIDYKRGLIENWELSTFKTKSYMPFSVAIYLVRKQFLRAHPKK